IVYKVNFILEGQEPDLELWSACTECAGPCECGWLVLKLPRCFTLDPTNTDIPSATVTIYDGTRFIEIGVAELEAATHTDIKVIGDYRYYFWCLDGLDPVGIQKITAGKSYKIVVNKGAFKFTNGSVTFGWPCEDWKKNKVQAK
ncbi:MAG: hypothetical protein N2250_04110, partial [Pseudothermotoga sp.]|nr:hypothetical protein [Pseudothermotoga sp.]